MRRQPQSPRPLHMDILSILYLVGKNLGDLDYVDMNTSMFPLSTSNRNPINNGKQNPKK